MSYVKINNELLARAENFKTEVFDYLEKTGRSHKGRGYFGTVSCGNPNLIARMERGEMPGLEVMLRVWVHMEEWPVEKYNEMKAQRKAAKAETRRGAAKAERA